MITLSKLKACCAAALAVLLALTLTSCDSMLEETPESSLSPSNYYRNADDASTALTGAYGLLQSGYTPHSGFPSGRWYLVATDETYNLIIQDLTQAAEDLPVASATDYGRATKGAAQTLLAKAYLQRGSASTCSNCGTMGVTPQPDDYQTAAALLEEVMSSGEYSLVADYGSLFQLETEVNDEIIFAARRRSSSGNGESVQNFLNPQDAGWFFGSFTEMYGELPF